MKKSRFTDSQIMAILKKAESGIPVTELCRENNISTALFYQWRSKYGGMDISMISRLKELEAENAQLKKMYAEERLKAEIVQDALKKKVVKPSHGREMAMLYVEDTDISIKLACRAFAISETCYRYIPKQSAENEQIADWLLRLTTTYKRWGFGLCFLYLRNVKNYPWNHKRVYRIYRELGLNLRIKPRRKIKRDKPDAL